MSIPPIAGAMCLLLSTIVIATNWIGMLRALFFKRSYSTIPLIGGMIGVVGLLITARFRGLFWLPPLLDPGCSILAAMLLVSGRKR
ncbi:MAG TPA: hypothetical protein VFF39_04550 [Verrucomicrobiae bacterium]|jgi:hypothetical protein|nr:hypothetical protein [Verrucomicrobiae bacterium]